jgi:hypothetical protein
MPDRQIQQDGIGQLLVPHHPGADLLPNVRKSALQRPETVRVMRRHPGQGCSARHSSDSKFTIIMRPAGAQASAREPAAETET